MISVMPPRNVCSGNDVIGSRMRVEVVPLWASDAVLVGPNDVQVSVGRLQRALESNEDIVITLRPITGEVDDQSISDQGRMKQHWETVIASEGEPALFPRSPDQSETARAPVGPGSGVVESPSIIGELSATKRQWENAMESERRHLPEVDRDAINGAAQRLQSTGKDEDAGDGAESAGNERFYAHESIIEREIRLQREREQEFCNQRNSSFAEQSTSPTPIHITTSSSFTSSSAHYIPTHTHVPNHSPAASGKSPPPVRTHTPSPTLHSAGSSMAQIPTPSSVRNSTSEPAISKLANDNVNSMTNVSYEDAISTYSHPGESLIAKELREQREREQELRARYTSMGIKPPTREASDTPSSLNCRVYQPHSIPKSQSLAPIVVTSSPQFKEAGSTRVSSVASPPVASCVVTPLSNGDDAPSYDYRGGAGETPIEREIRIAREREIELRREKGLPPGERHNQEETMSPGVEVRTANFRSRPASDADPSTIRRLAKSRLEHEMIEMRMREDSMRREGALAIRSPAPVQTQQTFASETATVNGGRQGKETHMPKSFSTGHIASDKFHFKKSQNKAESKIEQELREMREREVELRRTRSMLTGQGSKIENSFINNNHADGEEEILNEIGGNRGNIADQWEQRIAGN